MYIILLRELFSLIFYILFPGLTACIESLGREVNEGVSVSGCNGQSITMLNSSFA
jgi:hypothetical protein